MQPSNPITIHILILNEISQSYSALDLHFLEINHLSFHDSLYEVQKFLLLFAQLGTVVTKV